MDRSSTKFRNSPMLKNFNMVMFNQHITNRRSLKGHRFFPENLAIPDSHSLWVAACIPLGQPNGPALTGPGLKSKVRSAFLLEICCGFYTSPYDLGNLDTKKDEPFGTWPNHSQYNSMAHIFEWQRMVSWSPEKARETATPIGAKLGLIASICDA